MPKLTKSDLLKPWQVEILPVQVNELGEGSLVYVRSFSAAERSKLEVLGARFRETKNYDDTPKLRLLTVALSLCDEQGTRMFDESELDLIAQLPAVVVDRIFEAAGRINGLDAKKAQELEKNS